MRVLLHTVAHARAGDKGNRVNISLFPYDPAHYAALGEQVTAARVLALFRHRGATSAVRYELPLLGGFNFVVEDALEGGVNSALNQDGHGKTLSFRVLELEVDL